MLRTRFAVLAAVLVAAAVCLGARGVRAEEQKLQKVPLLHADALLLSIAFGADPPKPITPQQQAAYERSAAGFIARQQQQLLARMGTGGAVPPAPPFGPPGPLGPQMMGGPPMPRLVAQAVLVPPDSTFQGELATFLPEGLIGPPVAVEQDNSLMVKGSPAAIDEFREVVALFDQPVGQVNIRCDFVDALRRQQQAWGLDLFGNTGQLDARVQGNVPAGNIELHYNTGDFAAILAALQTASRSRDVVSANVTTLDRSPAQLTVGQQIPYVQNIISYGPFGEQLVQQVINTVFTGVELFVLPRIHGDKVTMLLRPSLIDQTGAVTDPTGQQLPITRQVLAQTIVTVPDGQTLCIGGMPRANWNVVTPFSPFFGQQERVDFSDLLVFVTPKIIREQEERD